MLLSAISLMLVSVILLWTMYHIPIIIAGIRWSRDSATGDQGVVAYCPKFSLVVPAKNEDHVITRCLRALVDLDYPREKLEIIVVEAHSAYLHEHVSQRFARAFPRIVKVLQETRSTGKPQALNFALPHITGEVVGVFDADSIPERDVLKRVAAKFQDQSVMAVQGRTSSLNPDENMLTRMVAMERRCWLQSLVNGRATLGLFVPLTGSCQFVRRAVLEKLGGWAEASLAEDVELSLRLLEKNYSVTYAPDVCAREETPSRLGSLIQQRTRWYRGHMEEGLKYGRLLQHLNWKTFDAEITVMGPVIMVVCLAGYLTWALSLLLPPQPIAFLPMVVGVLISFTLFSIGAALAFMERPVRFRNLAWIPFIYAYWFMQTLIAGQAVLMIVLRRPRVWQKTDKQGTLSRFSRRGRTRVPFHRVTVCSSHANDSVWMSFAHSYGANLCRGQGFLPRQGIHLVNTNTDEGIESG